VAFSFYGLYFLLVLRQRKVIDDFQETLLRLQEENSSNESKLENVSIIVSTFNEAKVIARKIENLSALDYPKQKMEIIVFDDSSTDGTAEIAEKTIREKQLSGKVVRNSPRIGLNRSLNAAVAGAKNNLVCITDSDVLLEKNSLRNSISVLQSFKDAGGVTGHIQPVFEGKGMAQTTEASYRGYYHDSMLAESALHSAFPGNGPLIVYNKMEIPTPIPVDYGSTDGNIAMNIIKKGLRFIYVPNAIVYEPEAENMEDQRLQKVRRAKRLLQVLLHNTDISFNQKYGFFGSRIFPIKLMMMSLSPILFLIGTILTAMGLILSQNTILYALAGIVLVGAAGVFAVSKKLRSFFSSFVLHQVYLIVGLFSASRKSVFWKTIDRKTKISS
jgi:cellulose synthase/poly-beta-1,6-N-acetylglucosamine synthase-like glycosyltransferase